MLLFIEIFDLANISLTDRMHTDPERTMDVMSASTLVATALLLTPVTTIQATSMSTKPVRTLLILGAQPDAISERPKTKRWYSGWKRHRAGSVQSRKSHSLGGFSIESSTSRGKASVDSRGKTLDLPG